jgi:hypothetical protein
VLPLLAHAQPAERGVVPCGGINASQAGCAEARPFRDRPQARVRVEEVAAAQPLELKVYLSDAGRDVELPRFYGSARWSSCGIPTDEDGRPHGNAIVGGDFIVPGRDDLAVVGECMSGIGPAAAEPFYAGAIYVADEHGALSADEAASGRFTALLRTRCGASLRDCDVDALARTAER